MPSASLQSEGQAGNRRLQALARELAATMGEWPEVVAVANGGSLTSGYGDLLSDLDLYVYTSSEVPIERRRRLIEPRAAYAEVGNNVWEPGDEWQDRETGICVDTMFRTVAWAEEELERVVGRCEAAVGYTTCILHNLRTSTILFDRDGSLSRLQKEASAQYPPRLAEAIIAKNLPLLADVQSSFLAQILKACERRDIISCNHRTAAFLASYFDVLFALNLATHPGEKRLLATARALPLVPTDLQQHTHQIIVAAAERDATAVAASAEALVKGLRIALRASPSEQLRRRFAIQA